MIDVLVSQTDLWIREAIDAYRAHHPETEVLRFDLLKGVDLAAFMEACQGISLFGSSVVFLAHADAKLLQSNKSLSTYLAALVHQDPESLVLFLGMSQPPGARHPLLKVLKTHARIRVLDQQRQQDYLSDLLNQHHVVLDDETRHWLAEALGDQPDRYLSEVEKLALWPQPMAPQLVRRLVHQSVEAQVLNLTDAFLHGRKQDVLKQLDQLKKQRSEPLVILQTLGTILRRRYQFLCLQEASLSSDQIAQRLAISPRQAAFFARDRQLVFSLQELLGVLDKLATLDFKIKTGIVDKQLGMELFFLEATGLWIH